MPLAQGKRIVIITRKEYDKEVCLVGWLKPADVRKSTRRG
jgi:hypothetical protein